MTERTPFLAPDHGEPLHAEPATLSVLGQLREMMVTGAIPAGTRLRAEALASQLNVSRTPIRSALAVLAAEGLVSYSVNRGYTVHSTTLRDILDSVEVRGALESLAARLSVEFGWEPAAIDELASIARRGREIVDAGRWSAATENDWYQLNRNFHRTIHLASHNAVLRNAIRMSVIYPIFGDVVRVSPIVSAAVPPRARQMTDKPPQHILESQDEHEALIAAIRAGDAAAAGEIMGRHVLATKTRVHALATLR